MLTDPAAPCPWAPRPWRIGQAPWQIIDADENVIDISVSFRLCERAVDFVSHVVAAVNAQAHVAPTDADVERVARALHDTSAVKLGVEILVDDWDEKSPAKRLPWIDLARAAIAAMKG